MSETNGDSRPNDRNLAIRSALVNCYTASGEGMPENQLFVAQPRDCNDDI
jgi:hypothetical protein